MLAPTELLILTGAFFIIALLYSSVGFGGGSSYLAILTLALTSFFLIRSSALLCNLVVVSSSCFLYYRKGHLPFKKFLPFIITSVPLAFLGATFRLQESVFFIILGASLIISAIALVVQTVQLKSEYQPKAYPKYIPYFLGGVIGLLSGLVGIGGGIFLAPLLNHLKWEKPIVIASLASFFILVNSVSGIFGLLNAATFELPLPEILYLVGAVFVGGQIGVRISLGKFSEKTIRLVTAFLVFVVGCRVLFNNGLQIQFLP
ncbi:sulfite exporter TauE/SafE family protein [Allomuricauda sp. d1]|uniref:sulfite exporter TauE/SafE family protein n=1 Tax=Allomuricauda sp. d1 TaxID=3136725 RepID=UPI0031CF9BB7